MKKKKKSRKSRIINLILIAVFLVGLSLLLYPTFSNWWNSFHQTRAIMHYMETVSHMDTAEYERIITSAQSYNDDMRTMHWDMTDEALETYNGELDANGDGNMGYITIPKINVMLPIFHGTDESVLQSSIGHLEWSSLPVGGKTSHCVLSGHRGLPSARLFTDLDKLVVGDTFTLSILNEILTYEVDQIRVVEPTDLSTVQLVPGRDYCTLVTCTPYGINSHRLLVRGHRIANAQGEAKVVADAMQIETVYVVPFVGVPILTLLLIMLLIVTGRGKRKGAEYREILELDRIMDDVEDPTHENTRKQQDI
ncbi:MAG: class C sortase [Ruminococcaceae bacterium]|jgi:sortase A|nr:class C sortase [Oscillospiraceae bacterium]